MNVVLIDLPYQGRISYGDSVWPNAGLGYLASVLMARSHKVRVLDFLNDPKNIEARLKAALAQRPDVVGLYVTTATRLQAAHISNRVNEIFKPRLLVAGGPHISIYGKCFMLENHFFDVGVVGEGESSIIDLCDAIEGQKRLEEVEGIIFRNKSFIDKTPPRALAKDLDSLQFPEFSAFDSVNKNMVYPLITSRGCPYECSFCCVSAISQGQWRPRDITQVIEELEYAKPRYKVSKFVIVDDAFTYDRARANLFCDLLISRSLRLSWSVANVRADEIDSGLCNKMKEAGCEVIYFGLESGDPSVYENVGKRETFDELKSGVCVAMSSGLKVGGHFIIGLPGSTFEAELKSLEFAKRLKLDFAAFWQCFPFPGTRVYEYCKKNARFLECNDRFHDLRKPLFETADFSKERRIKAYFICNLQMRQFELVVPPRLGKFFRKIYIVFLLFKYNRSRLPRELFLAFRKRIFRNSSFASPK